MAAIPFNLPAGFTVNSADAGIVDNFIGESNEVPALGLWSQAILCALLPLVWWRHRHGFASSHS